MLCDETFPTHSHTFSATTRHLVTDFEECKDKSLKVGMMFRSCYSDNTKPVMPFWRIFILEHISRFNVNTRNNILLNFYQSEHRTEQSRLNAHWLSERYTFFIFMFSNFSK